MRDEDDVIDLGSVVAETKGVGREEIDSFGQPLNEAGISDD